jgi:hypothetical protein
MEPLNNTDKVTALIREGNAALKKGRRNAAHGLKIVHETRHDMMRKWGQVMKCACANENHAGARLRVVR